MPKSTSAAALRGTLKLFALAGCMQMSTALAAAAQGPTTPPTLTPAEVEVARATPPMRQFMAYLDALRAGDRERMRRFIETTHPSANLEGELGFSSQTGGFDLREIHSANAREASGFVQEHNSDQFARFTIVVDSSAAHKIERLQLRAVPRPAAFAIARMSEDSLVSALRAKLANDVTADRFSGAVILAKLGGGRTKVLLSGAYGMADREAKVANTLDTKFRIGSMNKMFTATSILQLVQAGKIKLTDPLGKYLTDYPNKDVASKVTIHQLLTHTGGTGDIFGPDFAAHRLELRALTDYVGLYGARGLRFEPGSRWEYSNYGMLLLGVVIERVSGQNYYDYVEQHVFRPAGMTHSGSLPEDQAVPDRSMGYMRRNGAWMLNTNTLPYRGTSAGGGYSSVGDLLAFAEALMNNKLLTAEYTSMLITGKVDVAEGRRYAYGFEDARANGEGAVGHGGGAPGMNGDLRIYPRSGYVIAVLSNLDPPAASQITSFVDARLPR